MNNKEKTITILTILVISLFSSLMIYGVVLQKEELNTRINELENDIEYHKKASNLLNKQASNLILENASLKSDYNKLNNDYIVLYNYAFELYKICGEDEE